MLLRKSYLFKKIITEIVPVLPLYIVLFVRWWRFLYIINIISIEENKLSNDEFFADSIDTPEEGVEHHGRLECLKVAISKGKVLGGK